MNEFDKVRQLIRLKRFEQPGEDFTETFLREFHHRQRAEMLRKSSVELLMERVSTWWEHLVIPKWSLAAAATACVAGIWLFIGDSSSHPSMADTPTTHAVPRKPFTLKLDLSDLPMANMAERGNAKLEDALIREHLEIKPTLESGVSALPTGAKGFKQWLNGKPAQKESTKAEEK